MNDEEQLEKQEQHEVQTVRENNRIVSGNTVKAGAKFAANRIGGNKIAKVANLASNASPLAKLAVRFATKKISKSAPNSVEESSSTENQGAFSTISTGTSGSGIGRLTGFLNRDKGDQKGSASGVAGTVAKIGGSKASFLLKWKKIKLIAIACCAGFGFMLLLTIVAIIAAVVAPLDFGEGLDTSSEDFNYSEEYKEYWGVACSSNGCDENMQKMFESQEKFYKKLDSFNLTKRQKNIIVSTLLLNYSFDEFTEDNGAYTFTSEDDENSENNSSSENNEYEENIGSIDHLVGKIRNGEEAYFEYLRTSDYLDKRPKLISYYEDYSKYNGLNTNNISFWPESDKIAVREQIISNIKGLVDGFDGSSNSIAYVPITNNTSYWWPIGSIGTTEENGILFASDDPEFTYISSYYGYRVHPVTGARGSFHSGIDIPGKGNSTNVIASMNGTVINIYNSCNSYSQTSSDYSCGGGAGNYIEIQDLKGNTNIYMHLYKNSMLVNVGDTVVQGQVIAKVGSSGSSTGYHLHFTIKVNGMTVNPLDYVDSNNPRPSSSSLVDFNRTAYSKEEFNTILVNYYSQTGVCNSSSTQYLNGCNSMKNEILLRNGAEIIYDTAGNYNINPELVIARSMLEGYSPGTDYNYFGYRCYNTGGLQACQSFSSFKNGMEAYFKNVSQYDSLESMLSRYAYLGDYWYTGVHWGWGGCAYASEIYPDGVPNRVKEACSYPDGYCSVSDTSNCTPTTQDDLNAYTQYQVRRMTEVITKVFR